MDNRRKYDFNDRDEWPAWLLDIGFRYEARRYLVGRIDASEFFEWLVAIAWEMDETPPLAAEMLRLEAELSAGRRSEDQIRQALRELLDPPKVYCPCCRRSHA